MRRLSPIDTAFLLAESRNQPLHVGALCVFHPPAEAPADYVANIADRLRSSNLAGPPFNRRLESHWGIKSWVEAKDFDLAQHFVHLSLPKPGRILELLSMVSRVHSAHLDRAYPLWRAYLIEGIEDGRIALYFKIHHALIDGVAGIRLMMKSMSEDPIESMQIPAPWEMRPSRGKGKSIPAVAFGSAAAALQITRAGLKGTPTVLRHLREVVADYRNDNPYLVTSFQAPNSILNQSISGSRRFAAQSYPTARIRQIAKALDSTVNDVVLSLCGGALRLYLDELNALPEQSLTAVVPVSVRRDDSETGNEIAMALTGLGTDIEDPIERARQVKGCMDYNKATLKDMTPAQIMAYSAATLAPGAATLLPGIKNHRRAANLVISHVRGPQTDTYWQGCKLDGIYPASLVLSGFALNITLISRHDNIDFGIIACRRSLPSVQRLLLHLEAAITELESALNLSYDPTQESDDCKAIHGYCIYPRPEKPSEADIQAVA
ncbi:MAG: wax ester/triacylglycerol synthase family O-acyltransferase [Salinisphaeraceae bacterium]|nr:wax ester/triacylglycerol synthase family O-acyltransferase [Salinisphaeraceae bacterium]